MYKHAFFYMLRSWRVPLIVTRHFYTYQSFILSKKLITKNKLTGRPSPTVECNLMVVVNGMKPTAVLADLADKTAAIMS